MVQYSEITETLLRGKPVQFVQEIDPALPLISGDRRRIRQILINLVSNAVKFTEQGMVTLRAHAQGDHVLFAIMDTGPGIAAEMQAAIFEPFVQTGMGSQHVQGTGLGLPITKSLVEAYGGRLWLESEVGEGATCYVSLPAQMVVAGR